MKAMKVTPLQRVSLKDRVAQFIRDAILSGKLESGDRIVELKLAKDLGIGTTAVREALFELESLGFVTRIISKGTFVTRLTAEDVAQIFEVREQLEGLALDLVQKRLTVGDVALLQKHADEMKASALENDAQRFYRSDLEFHRAIWRLSGNRYLARSLDLLVVPLFTFFIMKHRRLQGGDLLASVERHLDVVRALREGGNARQCLQTSIQFFWAQEDRLLFKQAGAQSADQP
jgi:DNA-binding GntR family transcriptional regulator